MKKILLMALGIVLFSKINFVAQAASSEETLFSNETSVVLNEENSSNLGIIFSETKDVLLDSGLVVEVKEELTKISHDTPFERKVVDTSQCIVGTGTYEHTITFKVPGINYIKLVSNTTYYVSTTNRSVTVKATNTGGTGAVGYTISSSSSFSKNYAQSDYTANAILFPGTNTYTISKNFSILGTSGSNLIVKIVTNFY